MEKLKKIIIHPYFSYLYLFVVIFCIISLLFLPREHPLTIYAVTLGIGLFVLQRYRKYLLKQQQ